MDQVSQVEEPAGCLASVKDSIAGVGFGFVMVVVAFPLLLWNEGRAVDRARDLATGRDEVSTVNSDQVSSSFDGDLVHVTGNIDVKKPAQDRQFGVRADAVVLQRNVQMYQWKENKRTKTVKRNGKKKKVTRYSYSKTWTSTPINSASFHDSSRHQNPSMPFNSQTFYAPEATLGAFTLARDLKRDWPSESRYKLTAGDLGGFHSIDGRSAVLRANEIFYGDPSSPTVGAVRVRYKVGRPAAASVVAGQTGQTLSEWSNEQLNDTIGMISRGNKSAGAMFEQAEDANARLTWILRGVGFVVMFFGFNLISGPIDAIASMAPIAGAIVDFGTTAVSGLLAVALTAITIAVGWIFFRPLIGVSLLAGGLAVIGAGIYLATRKSQ